MVDLVKLAGQPFDQMVEPSIVAVHPVFNPPETRLDLLRTRVDLRESGVDLIEPSHDLLKLHVRHARNLASPSRAEPWADATEIPAISRY